MEYIAAAIAAEAAGWLRDRVNEIGFTSCDLLGVYEAGENYPPLAEYVALMTPEIATVIQSWLDHDPGDTRSAPYDTQRRYQRGKLNEKGIP